MTLAEIKQEALDLNVPIISDLGLEFIKGVIQKYKYKRILEIGSGNGYSALAFQMFSGGNVITIEISHDSYLRCKKNLQNYSKIRIILGDAKKNIPQLKFESFFDFIFVDANKWEYEMYFDLVGDLLKKKGIMIFDNVLLKKENFRKKSKYEELNIKMSNFRQSVYKNQKYGSKLINIGDGFFLVKKK